MTREVLASGRHIINRDRQRGDAEHGPEMVTTEVAPGLTLLQTREQREIFTWDNGLGRTYVFDVTSMKKHIRSGRLPQNVGEARLSEEFYQHLVLYRSIQQWRVDELEPIDLQYPGIGLLMTRERAEGLAPVIVDGSHCFARRWQDGCPYIQMYILAPDEYAPYCVEDGQQEVFFRRFPPDIAT